MLKNEQGEEARIISLKEAAEILGSSYPTVLRMATEGDLKAFRMRRTWRTSTAACEEFIQRKFDEQARACQSIQAD
ncbi:MAG: excisionase family DNA-binding protein [Eggerthellaceae bacterium]|nr:excisionase family DNA-binding protein [Eggerthellaceae bacterium]